MESEKTYRKTNTSRDTQINSLINGELYYGEDLYQMVDFMIEHTLFYESIDEKYGGKLLRNGESISEENIYSIDSMFNSESSEKLETKDILARMTYDNEDTKGNLAFRWSSISETEAVIVFIYDFSPIYGHSLTGKIIFNSKDNEIGILPEIIFDYASLDSTYFTHESMQNISTYYITRYFV